MGPSIKFVSAIKDAIFQKKNGGQFFSGKKTIPGGGGAKGGMAKDHTSPFFLVNLSLIGILLLIPHYNLPFDIYDAAV